MSGPAASLTDAVRAIDEVAAIDPVSCTDDELAEAVGQWCHALSRLQAVGAPLLAAWDARRLWALDGSVNGPHWLRTHGEVDDATGRVRVARRLRDWCPRTKAALASGRLSATKAAIIARAPSALTAADFAECEDVLVETAIQLSVRQTVTLVREWKAIAESQLGGDEVDLAEVQRTTRHLRIWETFDGMIAIEGLLAPETGAVIKAALATLERRLLREDVQEAKACEAATRDDTPAPTSADAEQLMPSASAPPPPAAGASGAGDVADGVPSLDPEVDPDLDQGTLRLRRTAGQRRADALAELVRLGSDLATTHHDDRLGGPETQLVLTMPVGTLVDAAIDRAGRTLRLPGAEPLDQPAATVDVPLPAATQRRLAEAGDRATAARRRAGVEHAVERALGHECGRAHLDDHEHAVDPTVVGLLACDCAIHRLVVDPDGVPLDLGRTQRLVSREQRRALRARDGGCAFPGCDRPPSWCDAHHIVPWEIGGPTDLDNLVLLCRRHHTMQHTKKPWTCRIDPVTRRPEFFDPQGWRLVGDPRQVRARGAPPPAVRSVPSRVRGSDPARAAHPPPGSARAA